MLVCFKSIMPKVTRSKSKSEATYVPGTAKVIYPDQYITLDVFYRNDDKDPVTVDKIVLEFDKDTTTPKLDFSGLANVKEMMYVTPDEGEEVSNELILTLEDPEVAFSEISDIEPLCSVSVTPLTANIGEVVVKVFLK